MPTYRLQRDVHTLKAAAEACGLELQEGKKETPSFPWTPSEPISIRLSRDGFAPCQHVLRLAPASVITLVRPPHSLFVYARENEFLLLREDHPDGFGLTAFIGQDGSRLKIAFAIENVRIRLTHPSRRLISQIVGRDKSITITYEDIMDSQRSITVRIGPKGDVGLKTAGYEGPDCQKATKALEQSLGVVESDTATEDMHVRPPELEISQTAGG